MRKPASAAAPDGSGHPGFLLYYYDFLFNQNLFEFLLVSSDLYPHENNAPHVYSVIYSIISL